MMNPNNSIKENQAMRKRYGTWVAIMVAALVVLGGISSVRAQLLNTKYYPTLSLRNWHCNPDGIQRVPTPGGGGDRFFLVPIYIYNEVDTTFNPNAGGQHLEPIRSFEFKFIYLTQAMVLDTEHGDPIVKVGPDTTMTALAKSFVIHFSDQPDLSTGNPYLHVIRIAGASSTPLPLATTADSGCSENSGVLFWLRFRVVVSAVNAGEIHLDSSLFNDHQGDSLLNPPGGLSVDYHHGNFGGGSGQNSQSKKGYGLVQITDQPAFILRPLSQVQQIGAAVDSLVLDLVYDPTQPGGGVSRILQLADAVGNTELDNVDICSDQQWLVLNTQPGGGGSQCKFIKKIDYTQSFGSEQKDIYLNVPNPGQLSPGVYYATVTFSSYGASNSPLKLIVRFVRLAAPSEPSAGGTGIRLNISNSCNPVCSHTLTFGTGPGATEGIDVLYGEQVVSVADTIGADSNIVPSLRCTAYFKPLNPGVDPQYLDPNFVGLTRDIRSDMADTTLIYEVDFNAGDPNCYPVKVCVDPADFPAGGKIAVKFTLNGSDQGIDLRQATPDPSGSGQRCITINDHTIRRFYIYYTPQTLVDLGTFLKPFSWTLISLPVIPPNPDAHAIFPHAVTPDPFYYSTGTGWTPQRELVFGRGYMIRYGDCICGDGIVAGTRAFEVDNVQLQQGWNTIGGISVPVAPFGPYGITLLPNSGGTTVPQIESDLWEFTPQNGYQTSNFLIPGQGYFIKVSASGLYKLGPAPAPPGSMKQDNDPAGKASVAGSLMGQLAKVTVRDAQSNGQSLYFGHATTDVPESHFEMPSSFTGFDARFATNGGMMSYNHDAYVVNVKSNSFPMTMSFSNVAGEVTVTDMAGNTLGTVSGNGIVTIAQPLTQVKIALKSSNQTMNAAGYQLEQNTPNPFTPITTIHYSIPQESVVSLVVYNQLGQVVATLVSGTVGAGEHEALFNGTNLAPGTYYYTLKAGNFVQTQHMTLEK